ncbi:MAG: hypothetical protein FJ010_06130 [Chloroflexi bacterium]|nr:hypothetical protein [Chloroflexota bacterium]
MSAPSDRVTSRNENIIRLLGLGVALLLGAFVRFVHVLPIEYPLNDGGFFFTLIQDLREANTILPQYTSYNQTQIPFAYPPLALFLARLLASLPGVSTFDLIRLLPPILSCLTIPAFYLLARALLPTTIQVISAAIAFALLPTAFDPLIVGAGLTRAAGFLFALLTLTQIHSLYTTANKRTILLAILFASLTVLSHPGTAWFALYIGGVLLVFFIRWDALWESAPHLARSILVALGTALLTSPWWATLIYRHGLATLLFPYQTESFSLSSLLTPFSLLFTNEPLVDILAVIGFLGLLASLRARNYLLLAWLAAVFVFEPRLSAVYAAIPTALLVGVGVERAILPLAASKNSDNMYSGTLAKCTVAFLLIYALVSAYLAPGYNSLSQAQAASMEWVSHHTTENSTFLLLTGHESYGDDYTSEWFPALSRRSSLATPQGHEWLPDREFSRRVKLHTELQSLASTDITDLEVWANRHQLTFSHIYIATKALKENEIQVMLFQESLADSSRYELIFENEDAMIFAQRP